MMEVALPDMEELAWNLEKLKLDLEGVLAKRRLLEKI
jgi:hypothetical protein